MAPGTDTDSTFKLKFNAKPDLVWIKNRDSAENHVLYDTVRGAYQYIYSNEQNQSNDGTSLDRGLTKFDFNGFTVKDDLNGGWGVNKDNDDFVAWCWKAGDENVQYAADTFTDEVINKSENWSSTSDLTNSGNLFNDNIWNGATYTASTTRNITTSSFTATTIRIRSNGGNEGQTFTVNGTGYAFPTGNNSQTWNEIDLGTPTTVTSLQVSGTGNFTMYAIEVDGKVLVDSTSSLVFPGLASTVRANSEAGFSIIQYSGGSEGSVSHGLSSAPKFVMVKRTNADNIHWAIYHNSTGSQSIQNSGRYYLQFDTNSENLGDTYWGGKNPTDRVINLGTSTSTNTSGGEYIMYAWHDVPGLQKFGGYTGNNDGNGPYVELGFKPAIVWIKCSGSDQSGNAHWIVFDTTRSEFNPSSNLFLMNENHDEYTSADGVVGIDLLSNGFKLRDNNTSRNAATTYIYCAWAAAPSFNLYGGQSNAR